MSADLAVAGLGALLLAALVAATLLPAQSELVLTAMLLAGRWDPAVLVAVATAGNVAGSMVNWLIGRFFSDRRDARWFPVPAAALERAEQRFRRFGLPVLLLSWVPIIGDPITLVAGLPHVRLLPFLLVVDDRQRRALRGARRNRARNRAMVSATGRLGPCSRP